MTATVLYRWYKYQGKNIKALQGKVFEVEGKSIYYRDIWEHKSRLWDADGAWNLDYKTYEWLVKQHIEEVHYFWHKDNSLYIITVGKIKSQIKKGFIQIRQEGGHRQLFIVRQLFTKTKKTYNDPWIKKETDVSKIEKLYPVKNLPIATDIRYRLKEIFLEKYPEYATK